MLCPSFKTIYRRGANMTAGEVDGGGVGGRGGEGEGTSADISMTSNSDAALG